MIGRAVEAPISVDVLVNRSDLRALRPVWEALRSRAGQRDPFGDPGWFAVHAAALARGGGSLHLLVAHRRGELIAALPLWREERRRLAGLPARVLRSLSDDHCQRFAPPCPPGPGLDAIWRALAADGSWDALELRDLPVGGALDEAVRALARRDRFPVGEWPSQSSPWLALPPSVAELDAALPKKFRHNLTRRARRLADTVGPLAVERVDGTSLSNRELAAILDEGWSLEASGWKGSGGTAVALDPTLRARYFALARAFSRRGELSVYFLVSGGRRVAFHYALEAGGVYLLFKPGYDVELARFGPGHLLVREVCRDLIGRGVRELDFLGDAMPWKACWTNQTRRHCFRYVFAATATGRALWAWKTLAAPALRRIVDEAAARVGLGRPASAPDASEEEQP